MLTTAQIIELNNGNPLVTACNVWAKPAVWHDNMHLGNVYVGWFVRIGQKEYDCTALGYFER